MARRSGRSRGISVKDRRAHFTDRATPKAILISEEVMPTPVGFGTFAAVPEEQISENISRRILAGDQGMIVWWSIGAGVHVEPHSHPNEQIVWMLKGKMEFRLGTEQRVCGAGDVVVIREGTEHGGFPRRHRGDRFLRASARRLPSRRQTSLHERRLNSLLRLLTRVTSTRYEGRGGRLGTYSAVGQITADRRPRCRPSCAARRLRLRRSSRR